MTHAHEHAQQPTEPSILTVGHSNHSIESFISLLQLHRVTAIGDVRTSPFSRFTPHFNRPLLQQSLRNRGIQYVFLGLELGGRSDDPTCYDEGQINYARLAQTRSFEEGIERLQRGASRYRIAILCAEKEPLECHRTLLVARTLDESGTPISHIHADGKLETHAESMHRLVRLHGLDGDLFRSPNEAAKEALARQERRFAYTNKETSTEAARNSS